MHKDSHCCSCCAVFYLDTVVRLPFPFSFLFNIPLPHLGHVNQGNSPGSFMAPALVTGLGGGLYDLLRTWQNSGLLNMSELGDYLRTCVFKVNLETFLCFAKTTIRKQLSFLVYGF